MTSEPDIIHEMRITKDGLGFGLSAKHAKEVLAYIDELEKAANVAPQRRLIVEQVLGEAFVEMQKERDAARAQLTQAETNADVSRKTLVNELVALKLLERSDAEILVNACCGLPVVASAMGGARCEACSHDAHPGRGCEYGPVHDGFGGCACGHGEPSHLTRQIGEGAT